jgi:peptidyl-dipeptidase Dcp
VTADETAKSPKAVAAMLERLAPAAARNARAEQAALQAHVHDTGDTFDLAAWDWAFYAEKVRVATFDVDTAAMRQYFELEKVLHDGVFYAATRLYGITFAERHDLVGWHPDARVFEVTNEDGTPLGLYIADLYTRDSKRGGAWMDSLVAQSRLLNSPSIVTNSMNVPKPGAGEPTLLSFDEVNTLFHEFGHALHGLFAQVTYPKFAGTNGKSKRAVRPLPRPAPVSLAAHRPSAAARETLCTLPPDRANCQPNKCSRAASARSPDRSDRRFP